MLGLSLDWPPTALRPNMAHDRNKAMHWYSIENDGLEYHWPIGLQEWNRIAADSLVYGMERWLRGAANEHRTGKQACIYEE